jgi:hypothetical protein
MRAFASLLAVVLVITSACGSISAATPAASNQGHAASAVRETASVAFKQTASVAFKGGSDSAVFTMREPRGVILLYRLIAPRGTVVRGTVQIPHLTVPLSIRTATNHACSGVGANIVFRCTVGEEWCPMPAAAWRAQLRKVSGPAGKVTLQFRVGEPPPRANRPDDRAQAGY